MAATFKGLKPTGSVLIVGLGPEVQTSSRDMVFGGRRVEGSLTGDPAAGDATLRFSALSGVAAMTEALPLENAADAYAKMLAGKARFRMVLTMSQNDTGRADR